ncbi:MAG: hypothetical protein AAF337_12960 [Pseudomonadota bacterium]
MPLRANLIAVSAAALCLGAASAAAQQQEVSTDVYGPALTAAPVTAESQYVYLATINHLLEGATPDLISALDAISETALTKDTAARNTADLDMQLTNPILMQADPAAIVAIGRDLIKAGQANAQDLDATLEAMRAADPKLTDERLALGIMENGVRFRAALIQAFYSTDVRQLSQAEQRALEAYSNATLELRGGMEVMQFDIALGEVTDEALDLQRSAFAALQRGIIDEIDPYSFEEDAKRARQMTEQARASVAAEMRSMYLQLLLIAAVIIN